jgi:dihydroorotate dehydrogenase
MSAWDRLRPALFYLDPETAHRLAIAALKSGLLPPAPTPDPRLACTVAGLRLPGPIGLAAGFDKDAEVPEALLAQGFHFVETGSLTPKAQPGNPRPRLFRLTQEHAVINRMGFNNGGHAPALARLRARPSGGGVVGVNIGANKDSPNREDDYAAGLAAFWSVADYFAVNVSSPNTPGLRDLQAGDRLAALLERLDTVRDRLVGQTGLRRPLFVKLAPDLDETEIGEIAAAIRASRADGAIVSNTTVSRTGVGQSRFRDEAGGLSGRPLFARSTAVLARFRLALPDKVMIGAGGVEDAATARAKIEAGADLVQLYTAMVWTGPRIAAAIAAGLAAMLDAEGAASPAAWKGRQTEAWAGRPVT